MLAFEIVATAPGRAGIVGNPTDMYGGSVISCTTTERARCTITPSDRLILSADNGETQTINAIDDLLPQNNRLDLAKAVLRGLKIDPAIHRFHLYTDTEIPMQAGLSGSTALVAAVYGAVMTAIDKPLMGQALAEAIRGIEYEIMGVVCGFQDQHMAVFGGLNYMDFRDKGSHIAPENQPFATIEPLADKIEMPQFVLANTGVRHHSGTVHKSVRQRWLDGENAVRDGYERIRILAQIGKKALLGGDLSVLADAMNENQQIQHDLGASGKACDDLVAAAMSAGAYAAKLAGAGHGGTILALVTSETKEMVIRRLEAAGANRILHPKPSIGLTVQQKV